MFMSTKVLAIFNIFYFVHGLTYDLSKKKNGNVFAFLLKNVIKSLEQKYEYHR